MITVLGGQDVREKPCACDAAFDRSACCGGLHDLRTARAGELRSNVPNDLELLRHALEDLTHILTQVPELAAATWAGAGSSGTTKRTTRRDPWPSQVHSALRPLIASATRSSRRSTLDIAQVPFRCATSFSRSAIRCSTISV